MPVVLNEILLVFLATALAAIATDTMNDHPVTADSKTHFGSHRIPQFHQRIALKLEQLAASSAVEVIVLGISVIEFVNRPAIQLKALQQPGVDEFAERAIDRRRADVVLFAPPGQTINQLVGIKMIMFLKYGVDQEPPLTRLSQTTSLQILLESLLRRKRNLERLKGIRG
jgi:hypothetical protein